MVYPQGIILEKEYSKGMKSYWYGVCIVCAVVAGAHLAHAQTNLSVTRQALLEQLRAIQAQLISLQAVAPSPAPQTSADALAPARRGDRGAAVTAIQAHLVRTGDLNIARPTSYFGSLTEAAIKKLQRREGIGVTGTVNAETIAKIRARMNENANPPSSEPPPAPPPPAPVSGPDLVTRLSSIPPLTMAGQKLFFTILVDNAGSAASSPTAAEVFVDGNQVASLDVPAIESGASVSIPASATLEGAGDRTVKVIVDNGNLVAESSEANNEATLQASVTSTAVVPPLPPIGHWKFDGTGSNEIAGGQFAEKFGDASFQPSGGKYGGFAYIRGSGDRMRILHRSTFNLPTAFTIEVWFRARATKSAAENLIYKGADPNYSFRIFREAGSEGTTGAIVAGYTDASTGVFKEVRSPNDLPHGAWHHVVFTKSAEGRAYYLDGVLVKSDYSESPDAQTSTDDIVIGKSMANTDFDNLKIYNYSLNAAEVAYSYSAITPTVLAPTFDQRLANIAAALSALQEQIRALFP